MPRALFAIGAIVALIVPSGQSFAKTNHHPAPKTEALSKVSTIKHFAPDLVQRELSRPHVSWAHLRKMGAARWDKLHPAARRTRMIAEYVSNPTPVNNRNLARLILSPSEFTCADGIVGVESSWDMYATNSSSGAGGIPQALPPSKMSSAGADWATNPRTQIKWMKGYADGRYGSLCAAYSYRMANGYY